MADEKTCSSCKSALQPGIEAYVPIAAGFKEVKFPVRIYECPKCHLVQMYADSRRV